MLKNYLKIALRNLWKHKGYSFLNIAGLAVGIACALFILLWVQDELSFDRFHANAKSLYRVEQDQEGGQGKFHVTVTPYPLGPALKAEIPEVQEAMRSSGAGTLLIRSGENAFFEQRVLAVDPSIFRMFSFPLLAGDPATALGRPGSLVISEEMARKYFGKADPMGKAVTINNAHAFTVTGVVKNVPKNSSLRFDMLVPFDFTKTLGFYSDSFDNNSISTFVQLHEKSSLPSVGEKMTRLVRTHVLDAVRADPEQWKRVQSDPAAKRRFESYRGPAYSVMPLVDLNLYSYFGFNRNDQAIKYVKTFTAVALFVLLIACINFMNLATARSANRAREVGLRKVVGALRRSIAGQFYGESILTAVLSAVFALGLVVVLLPAFDALSGKSLTIGTLASLKFGLGLLAVTLLTGLVAGSYPALFLSAFQPIRVLKGGAARGAKGALFRKVLVVIQFSLSVLLLVGMGVVSRQIDFMRSKKIGYDKEQLVYLPMRGETAKNYAALKERLLRDPKILGVTASGYGAPTSFGGNSWGATWDGKDPNQRYLIGFTFVDFDFPETLKVPLAAGRTFAKKYSTDASLAFLVNEGVPRLMGLDAAAAVGKRFNFMGVDGTIVGVLKDFHYQSVRYAIQPLALLIQPKNFTCAIVRLKAGDVPGSLDAAKAAWLGVNPQYPFDYRFFDQDFDQMYRSDERMGAVLKVFAGMAVIIACLGLFGLASFTAEQRTKEIGVRKVLGASAPGLVVLLSREFAKWVLTANLLAWPVAYLLMRGWLQGFAYKAGIAWWIFALSGAGALAVALVTVSFQALRAAQTNPVNALKYE